MLTNICQQSAKCCQICLYVACHSPSWSTGLASATSQTQSAKAGAVGYKYEANPEVWSLAFYCLSPYPDIRLEDNIEDSDDAVQVLHSHRLSLLPIVRYGLTGLSKRSESY